MPHFDTRQFPILPINGFHNALSAGLATYKGLTDAQYAEPKARADIASKSAYATYMAPQIAQKALSDPLIYATMTDAQRNQATQTLANTSTDPYKSIESFPGQRTLSMGNNQPQAPGSSGGIGGFLHNMGQALGMVAPDQNQQQQPQAQPQPQMQSQGQVQPDVGTPEQPPANTAPDVNVPTDANGAPAPIPTNVPVPTAPAPAPVNNAQAAPMPQTISGISKTANSVFPNDPVRSELATAQAMQESYNAKTGKFSKLATEDNNYFGITGHPGDPNTVTINSREYQNGKWVDVPVTYKKYATPEEGFADYKNILSTHPRFAAAMKAKTFEDAATAVGASGYATDPSYSSHLIAMRNQYLTGKASDQEVATRNANSDTANAQTTLPGSAPSGAQTTSPSTDPTLPTAEVHDDDSFSNIPKVSGQQDSSVDTGPIKVTDKEANFFGRDTGNPQANAALATKFPSAAYTTQVAANKSAQDERAKESAKKSIDMLNDLKTESSEHTKGAIDLNNDLNSYKSILKKSTFVGPGTAFLSSLGPESSQLKPLETTIQTNNAALLFGNRVSNYKEQLAKDAKVNSQMPRQAQLDTIDRLQAGTERGKQMENFVQYALSKGMTDPSKIRQLWDNYNINMPMFDTKTLKAMPENNAQYRNFIDSAMHGKMMVNKEHLPDGYSFYVTPQGDRIAVHPGKEDKAVKLGLKPWRPQS